jgi:endonuclease/exonuclease/phosphatase family metal-dependent hydrolase
MRTFAFALLAVALVARPCAETPQPRLATFNIENFPKDTRQVQGAFEVIAGLGVHMVGVQEIGDVTLFRQQARARLGMDWRFVAIDTGPKDLEESDPLWSGHSLGLLFDGSRYKQLSIRAHDGTRLETRRHKPVLEVRLEPLQGGSVLRVFVLHLKSGSAGREIRRAQLVELEKILKEARGSGERIVVMGDFNATEPADRVDIARVAEQAGLHWATEPLLCTAFWQRERDCPTSSLDHVLTFAPPTQVEARGACLQGCDQQDRCPLYRQEISDHCPVVISFD